MTLPSFLCYSASWRPFSSLACLPQSTRCVWSQTLLCYPRRWLIGSSTFSCSPPSPSPSGVLTIHLSVTCCPLSQLVILSMQHGQSGFDSCFPQTTSAPSFPTAAGHWKQWGTALGPGLNAGGFILHLHHILPPLPAGLMLRPVSPVRPSLPAGFVISLSAAGLACSSTLLLFIPSPNRPTWLSRSSANSLFLLDNSHFFHLVNKHGSSAFCACWVLC